jgi:hypothetical protein
MQAFPEESVMRQEGEREDTGLCNLAADLQNDVIAVVICYYDHPHSGSDQARSDARLRPPVCSCAAERPPVRADPAERQPLQQIIDAVPEGVLLLDEQMQSAAGKSPGTAVPAKLTKSTRPDHFLAFFRDQLLDEILRPDAQVLWYEVEILDRPARSSSYPPNLSTPAGCLPVGPLCCAT